MSSLTLKKEAKNVKRAKLTEALIFQNLVRESVTSL